MFRVNPLGKVVAFVMPGHTVSLQSFTTVNVLIVWDEFVPDAVKTKTDRRTMSTPKLAAICLFCASAALLKGTFSIE